MRSLLHTLSVLPLVLSAGCVISIGGKSSWFDAGWSDLEHEHQEELELASSLGHLTVRTGSGDVHVRPADGTPRIVATVREEQPGDGYVVLEDGVLRVRSRGGEDVALGRVEVYLDGTTDELVLGTGSGDVVVTGVDVGALLDVSTGSGDVEVAGVGSPLDVRLATGSGGVGATDFACRRLDVGTGSGDVRLVGVRADEGDVDTGSGDVRAASCQFGRLTGDTGSGDLDLRGSRVAETSLRTGSGTVRLAD